MKALVVIPTYNERDTVDAILDAILGQNLGLDVLFVDDNSPDGTAARIKERAATDSHIRLIERPGKMGLGTAYVDGFQLAIKNGAQFVVQMDADFSHPPQKVVELVEALENFDVASGSRYIAGGKLDERWPLWRKGLSSLVSMLSIFFG